MAPTDGRVARPTRHSGQLINDAMIYYYSIELQMLWYNTVLHNVEQAPKNLMSGRFSLLHMTRT